VIDKPVPATYTTYIDPNNLFKISYPPDWSINPTSIPNMEKASGDVSQYLKSSLPSKAFAAFLLGAHSPYSPYSMRAGVSVAFRSQDVQPIPPYGDDPVMYKSTVGGREVTIVESSSLDPDAGIFRTLDMAIVSGKDTWDISCWSLPENYKNWEKDFMSILGSFRILVTDCMDCTHYVPATVTKMGVKFSFEYPSAYQDLSNSLSADSIQTQGVVLSIGMATWTSKKFDLKFEMMIFSKSSREHDAKFALNMALKSGTLLPDFQEYKLIEQSETTVANQKAYLMVASMKGRLDKDVLDEKKLTRAIYLEHGGYIWFLGISSIIEMSDQAKVDFDHITKSLKFLN
jgi:hypothetical protein